METKTTSVVASESGKVLGAQRPAVAASLVPVRADGANFASEYERALERSRGSELDARRHAELAGERRDVRRASFGRDDRDDGLRSDIEASEAVYRAENGPVAARAATVEAAAPMGGTCAAEVPVPFQDAAANSAPAETNTATPTPAAEPTPQAIPTLVANARTAAVPANAAQPVAAAAPAREPQPLPPPTPARPATTTAAKPARAPEAPAGTAMLDRAQEVLRQIELHATRDVRRITLELEPAELGRLSVQLALRAGKVAAIVRGEDRATLELLQEHENDLRAIFARRGIAADSVRFELGFRAPRGSSPRKQSALPSEPSSRTPRVDTHA